MKHNGFLSGSFPISNGVKQGCVLAPTLFSIFFSIMLRETKEDLPDGIYIHFRTDGSPFNLRRLLARTKTTEELITELLFADDCAPLALTEEALQHIVNRFSDAAKNFGLTISLKKTAVLYQPPPHEAYSPPHISIDGTKLNAVEHFTYLGSVIFSNATVSKDLDNRLSTSQGWKTYACPKQSSSASFKKESAIVVLQESLKRSAEETSCTGGNQLSVMAAGGLRPRQLALISEKSQL